MTRLTTHNKKCAIKTCNKYCATCNIHIDKLSELEDLDEKHLLLRLPCAEGFPVWYITRKFNILSKPFKIKYYDEIGKTIFLTKAAAEQSLFEQKGIISDCDVDIILEHMRR